MLYIAFVDPAQPSQYHFTSPHARPESPSLGLQRLGIGTDDLNIGRHRLSIDRHRPSLMIGSAQVHRKFSPSRPAIRIS
jgi:hypothetical protein